MLDGGGYHACIQEIQLVSVSSIYQIYTPSGPTVSNYMWASYTIYGKTFEGENFCGSLPNRECFTTNS